MTKTATTTTMILVNELVNGSRRFYTVEVGDVVSYFVDFTYVGKNKLGEFVLETFTERVTKEQGNALFFAFKRAGWHKLGTPATPEVPEPEKVAAPAEPERAAKKAEPEAPKAKAAKKNAEWFTRERYEAIAEEKGWKICVGSDRAGRPRMVITHKPEIYAIMKREAGIEC